MAGTLGADSRGEVAQGCPGLRRTGPEEHGGNHVLGEGKERGRTRKKEEETQERVTGIDVRMMRLIDEHNLLDSIPRCASRR